MSVSVFQEQCFVIRIKKNVLVKSNHLSQTLWRHLATKMRTMYCIWKNNPFWIRAMKTTSKLTHKPSQNTCLNYVPHAQADQAWHTKTENFLSYSRRA